jgi:hypothetical protein
MAVYKIVLFTKWSTVNGRNVMAVAETYPSPSSLGQEAGWTDLGQQDGPIITARSALYCTMALGKIDDAMLTAINADTHYMPLARWEVDVATPSFDNRQNIITTVQRDAFIAYFLSEFGINTAKIPVINNSPGRTRQAVLIDIVQDLRNLT